MELEGQQTNPSADTLSELNQINNGAEVPTSESPTHDQAPEKQAEGGNLDHPAAESQTSSEGAQGNDSQEGVTPPAIIYDGQTFATEKEAYEYMKTKVSATETEAAIMQAKQEAYEQAMMNMGQQPGTQAPVEQAPPEDDFNEEEYFSDPVGYTKRREAKLAAQIRNDIQVEQQARQADEQTWSEFFTANPDLDGFRADCEITLNQNLETIKLLARKDKKQAMQFLATKTREKFQTWAERQRPQTTLPNTKAGPSSGTGTPGVTPQASETPLKDVDFCSEINTIWNE